MASADPKGTTRNALICALWLCGVSISGFTVAAQTQENGSQPMRVESREVVVPVLVLDEKRVKQIQHMDPGKYLIGVTQEDNLLLSDVAVPDLGARDFQVFEDGIAQEIEHVTPQHYNLRSQARWLGMGQGRWVLPDLPLYTPGGIYPWNWVFHLIAYSPPSSTPGSCHQVTVKVDRPNSLVYTRGEYCNDGQPAADPLNGTKLGDQMFADLNSPAKDEISLSIAAFQSFHEKSGVAANIVIGFPANSWRPYNCNKPSKRVVVGVAYRTDGTVVARFSDMFSLSNFNFVGLPLPPLVPSTGCISTEDPYQYEIQLDLPPGEYKVKVIFSDGKRLGRAEIPLTVEMHDGKRLAISDVALARSYREPKAGAEDDPVVDAAAPPRTYISLVSKGFEVTPTANTVFHNGDPFDFYFEIFEPQPEFAAERVEAQLRIVDAGTGQVVKTLQPVDAAPYAKPGDPVIPIGGGIDISGLASGAYRLEVQATDSAGNSTPWRATNFTIER